MSKVPHPYYKKDALEWIKRTIKKWNEKRKKDYSFVIELKKEKKVIGALGLHQIDGLNKTSETGSWIAQPYWRKGFITEAKIVLNEFAFNKLKLRKLKSPIFVENKPSNATQKRLGYFLEGVLKKEVKSLATGKIHDSNVYGLFKEDWKKKLPSIKRHLQEKIRKLENKPL
jgi:RimJ/RimL family protein N-acetyltransferase